VTSEALPGSFFAMLEICGGAIEGARGTAGAVSHLSCFVLVPRLVALFRSRHGRRVSQEAYVPNIE